MSLLVWLPLTQDLRNNGLTNTTITNNGATIDNSGKLGKCYNFNNTSALSTQVDITKFGNNFSFCGWVNFSSTTSAQYIFHLGGGTSWQSKYALSEDYSGTVVYYLNGTEYKTSLSTSNTLNTWVHYAYTYDGSVVRIYINGSLALSESRSVSSFTPTNNLTFGARANNTAGTAFAYGMQNGKLNDVRVYNHTLSEKEIKELSKGLMVHYSLNDRYCTKNLIFNGFGQFGKENWTNNNVSTTEIPSADSTIKASYYNSNQTKDKIYIDHNTTYTISAYFKSTGATTGSTYPSLLPYDADNNFIATYNCAEGFNNTYLTTLAQPLKKGDTVIYATNLSAWNTGDNYYYHVAIFGYKDSFGTVYPDLGYTRDSPIFGTKTDKSHINKTNNTITLNAPYTGEDRPAGTVICQATEGSTYVYPFGGIALSTLSDWVFKTATLDPNYSRLKYAKYMYYFTYSSVYNAGIKLVDNRNNNIVYDISGNGYNGTPTDIDFSTDTPRYSNSTFFANGLNNKIIAPITIGDGTQITINIWMKSLDSSAGTGSYHMPININSSEFEFSIPTTGKFRQGFVISGSRKVADYGSTNLLDKQWHMLSATFDGTNIKRYIDGVLVDTTAASGTLSTGNKNIYIGTYGGSTQYASKNILESDLRIYATALSAEDIKELYQAAATIDKNGNLYGYEFKEV